MTEEEVVNLARALRLLTPSQLGWVKNVIAQFQLPCKAVRNPLSEWTTQAVLDALADALRIHHALSRQPPSKDRFEFAFERALNLAGISATLVKSRTHRGHDITIAGTPVSLKTEAAAKIREHIIHVSKWMELGKGKWELPALRDMFLDHMRNYERIFTLRCLRQDPPNYAYELVEIPKRLMLEARHCRLRVVEESSQTPKPGYGEVVDKQGTLKFALYFDAGTERKLQIRGLRKDLCVVHATFDFESTPLQETFPR